VTDKQQRERRNLNPTPEAVLATFMAIEGGNYPSDAMDFWDTLDPADQRIYTAMTAKIIRAWKQHQPSLAGSPQMMPAREACKHTWRPNQNWAIWICWRCRAVAGSAAGFNSFVEQCRERGMPESMVAQLHLLDHWEAYDADPLDDTTGGRP
jgi:hypothetical protein